MNKKKRSVMRKRRLQRTEKQRRKDKRIKEEKVKVLGKERKQKKN